MEDTHTYNAKISTLEEEICRFDSMLDRLQKLMPEDIRVYDHIVEVRDTIFRLQQSMRGCEIVEFASSGLDDVITPADWFWRGGDD